MIRALLALVAWLDRKFPPVVVVTQEDYNALTGRVHAHEKKLAGLEERHKDDAAAIQALEKSLAALKDGIAKGHVPLTATERARMRADFVEGNWERIPGLVSPVAEAQS